MAAPPALILFARVPELGRVKTRLATRLTDVGALRLYRAFLEDAARIYGSDGAWTPVLAGDPDAEAPSLAEIFPPPWRRVCQAAGDLGRRLTDAFSTEFARGAPAVLAVGSDHPALERDRLAEALELLSRGAQAVAIPAEDGGYCAIGLRSEAPLEAAFEEIPWSTRGVLEATQRALSRRGVALTVLSPGYDVDRPEDLDRLRIDLAGRDPSAADYPSATARALEEIR
jgi:rSAM/selenodomain-associated transferase 1